LLAAVWAGDIDLIERALARCESFNIDLDDDSRLLEAVVDTGSIEIWQRFRNLGWTSNTVDFDGWSLELVEYQSNNRLFDSDISEAGSFIMSSRAPGESFLTPSRLLFEHDSVYFNRDGAEDPAYQGRLIYFRRF
jgi:hypothetical protein